MILRPLACVCLASALLVGCAGTRHSVQLGAASLSSDYEPVDKQVTVGWLMNRDMEESGIGYEAGVQFGGDSDTAQGIDIASRNFEIWGGPRYEWVIDRFHPYLAGGLSILASEYEGSLGLVSISDDDTSLGLYLGAGVDFDVSERVYLGLGVRQTIAHEVTLFGVDGDADFTQLFLRLGMSF